MPFVSISQPDGVKYQPSRLEELQLADVAEYELLWVQKGEVYGTYNFHCAHVIVP